jgi:hypothetical protein
MKLTGQLQCPECGGGIAGSLDVLHGRAEMFRADDEGTFEFSGSTEMFYDEQRNVATEPGTLRVMCPKAHEWTVRVEGEDAPEIVGQNPDVDAISILLDRERDLSDALAEALRTHKTLDCWDCYDDAALTQFAKARGSHA